MILWGFATWVFVVLCGSRVRGVFFVDYGFTGENTFNIRRGGTGLGIEWTSPLGAIELIFAKPINSKPKDKTSTFEFSMGRRF
jgi:outer membrane protein insertion porin family